MGTFCNIKSAKPWFLRRSETGPEFLQFGSQFSMKTRTPSNHKNIEKTLRFPLFFEKRPSCYWPRFGPTFSSQNVAFWEPQTLQKPPRGASRLPSKTGPIFDHCLCCFLWVWGLQNGHQNQHETGPKMDPVLEAIFPAKNSQHKPVLARNGKRVMYRRIPRCIWCVWIASRASLASLARALRSLNEWKGPNSIEQFPQQPVKNNPKNISHWSWKRFGDPKFDPSNRLN